MLKGGDSERGQMIVLFVVVFTIFLTLAAFAIDQGYWYGRRRVTQGAADNAARAGIAAYLSSISDLAGAESKAQEAASANGISSSLPPVGRDWCLSAGDGMPSVEVRLAAEARRFLSGLPLISDESGPVEVGASAIACLGRVTKLYVANGQDSDDPNNRLEAIPIALRSDAPNAHDPNQLRACFSGGDLDLGGECVIYGSKATPFRPGEDRDDEHESWARRRMIFSDPTSSPCRGPLDLGDMDNDIEHGLTFTCEVTTSDTCDSSRCIAAQHINQDDSQRNVLEAMAERLERDTDCASPEGGEPAATFQNAFGNGSGNASLAPDPIGLGGAAEPNHVYVQNDCFNNPRVVLLPIVSSGVNGDPGTRSRAEPVRGFATVYITGCYHEDDINNSTEEKESNSCNRSWNDVVRCDSWDPDDDADNRGDGCFWEIRGVPIHVVVAGESLGGIAAVSTNAPLTIQTVK